MPGVDYKILFKIELLSDYYTDERARHLVVRPNEETEELLRNQHILWRQLNNKFILLLRVDGDGKPYIPIDPLTVFRFYVEVDHYFFLQYTTLEFDPASGRRYYFSNLNSNTVTSANPLYNKNYISKKLEAVYNSATNYAPGSLVLNNTTDNEVFEAVHQGINKALTEPHYWYKRTTVSAPKQYVYKDDLRLMRDYSLNVHLAAATQKAEIEVLRYNADSALFDIPAAASVQEFASPVQDVVVDLSTMSTGNYRVNVTSNSVTLTNDVYVDKGILEGGVLGVIEIFNNMPAASPYAFIDAAGRVKEPEAKFSLRFANRLAYWRYIARTNSVKNVKEKNNAFSFTPDGTKFLSSRPLAFHEKPYNIVIDFQKESGSPHVDIEGIKNASYQQVKKVSVLSGELFDCSEIYLNY